MTVKVNGEVMEPGFYAEPGNVRRVLADFMEYLEENQIKEWLLSDPSDDFSEEYDAIDKLNAVTENGYWIIDQGLYLVENGSDLDKAFQEGA